MTIAPIDKQLSLLNVQPVFNCHSNATARNAYGRAAETIVCSTLGLTKIPINGNYDVCFDAKKEDTFYEIKSLRQNNKLPLYKFRIQKEATAGVKVLYAILVHSLKNQRVDIISAMLNTRSYIIIVEAKALHALAIQYPLRKIKAITTSNLRVGYNRTGYRDGYYNVPFHAIIQIVDCKIFGLHA